MWSSLSCKLCKVDPKGAQARTESEWQAAKQSEYVRLNRKTVTELRKMMKEMIDSSAVVASDPAAAAEVPAAAAMAAMAADDTSGSVVAEVAVIADEDVATSTTAASSFTPDTDTPAEVSTLLHEISQFEGNATEALLKVKKEALASALAAAAICSQRRTETSILKQWSEDVTKIIGSTSVAISKASESEVCLDVLEFSAADLLDEQRQSVPRPLFGIHWKAHAVAAHATSFIIHSYTTGTDTWPTLPASGPGAPGAQGLRCFKDSALSTLMIDRKRIIVSTSNMALLEQVELCFAGRLLPVPIGQPVVGAPKKVKLPLATQ